MSNEKMHRDEEYQYPQDEYVVDSEEQAVEGDDEQEVSEQKPNSPIKEFLIKNKRKVAVASVGVLLLIIFQVMTHSRNQKVLKPAPVKPEVSKKVVTKPQVTSNYEAPAQPDARLIRSLQTIQSSGASNAEEIRELKRELQVLQNQLSDANRTNQQLKQAMVLLLQEVKQVNNSLKEAPKVVDATPEQPKAHYTATAMINGRAWILNAKGVSISVTIGDTIPGFGEVTDIDAARGVVFTSSGKTIGYGENDY